MVGSGDAPHLTPANMHMCLSAPALLRYFLYVFLLCAISVRACNSPHPLRLPVQIVLKSKQVSVSMRPAHKGLVVQHVLRAIPDAGEACVCLYVDR
jgi:hypothetical protein